MKHKLVMSRSSYLTSLPVLIVFFVLGVLSAVWEWEVASVVLLLLFLFSLLCRIWAQMAVSKLSLSFASDKKGIFPGETLKTTISVRNEKMLPVLWIELFLPLTKNHCLIPEGSREPEEWEKPSLTLDGASDTLVGSSMIPGLLWHEEKLETISWTAKRRGIYSAKQWRIRTGDGFGLAQVDTKLKNNEVFAVFPGLRDVDPSLFLRNLWNAEVGPKGVMEDMTVIRSTRGYSASDPAKRINWRLRARGLPLQVNVYENTLPRGVHFILDGESFSGPDSHVEELEETLSILASLAVELENHHAPCSLTLPLGKDNGPTSIGAESGTEAILWAMAAYDPCEKIKDDKGVVVLQQSVFDETELFRAGNNAGRNYYVVYDLDRIPSLLLKLDPTNTTILTWKEDVNHSGFETFCLRSFMSGGAL